MKKRHPLLRFFKHLFSHLFGHGWQIDRHFSKAAIHHIEQAISQSEKTHAGEIRFVVEAGLHPEDILLKKTPKKRAIELFGLLNIWDTEHNNGVLIYLLLADRDVEIVADRGIDRHVGRAGWEAICSGMEAQFKQGSFETGVLRAIEQIGDLLAQHYPAESQPKNEISNQVLKL